MKRAACLPLILLASACAQKAPPPPAATLEEELEIFGIRTSLNLGRWKLVFSGSPLYPGTRESNVTAVSGNELRPLRDTADLAALTASLRTADDVLEFYRVADMWHLADIVPADSRFDPAMVEWWWELDRGICPGAPDGPIWTTDPGTGDVVPSGAGYAVERIIRRPDRTWTRIRAFLAPGTCRTEPWDDQKLP